MASEYLQKRPINVVLWTNVSKIEGIAFTLQSSTYSKDNRLTDVMNFEGQKFLPIVDAKIYSSAADRLIGETNFVNVNKQHIIMIAERKE